MTIQDIVIKTNEVVKADMESSGTDLKPGDMYVAKRNTGWELLTCEYVNLVGGWVMPKETAYLYDLHECHKVIE